MKGKSYIEENKVLAFTVYCHCGGNVEATLRELKKQGLDLSKPTFNDWRVKFCFEDRRLKIDQEKQKTADNQKSFEDQMLNALVSQKEKYEKYFGENDKLDHQAQYAYAGIIKTIIDIRERSGKHKSELFLGFVRDFITYLNKNDVEAVPLLERNFDDFINWAKGQYGQ